MNRISAAKVRAWLSEGKEFAFIDVREVGQFGESHLLHAVNLPYSRLEIDAPAAIPNATVQVCVMDQGEGIAAIAARRLADIGYLDVAVVEGDLASFLAAGFTVFKGENVPSKVLGELVEEAEHTPSIGPEELKAMIDGDEDFLLLDGRSPEEFRKMSIPRAVSCPNAELGHRLPMLVQGDNKTIVVNCAGRTRSIIGAQSLRNLGFANNIVALRNGTQGWRLAGFDLEGGHAPQAQPVLESDAMDQSIARAGIFMARHGIPCVDAGTVAQWAKDGSRTLYLIDVRTAEEFRQGHLPGAIHVPGGQLVQQTDRTVAVRGARVVLCDDSNLRAANTAFWLRAMGHDASVLENDVSNPTFSIPVPAHGLTGKAKPLAEITAAQLKADPAAFAILDLRSSGAYRDAHIAGAVWAIRPKLASAVTEPGRALVLVAADRSIAELAAIDLREAGVADIRYLPGGADAWRGAGLEIAATPDLPSDAARIDFLFFVHDRHTGNLDAAREYLRWEMGLVAQMKDWELDLFPIHVKGAPHAVASH